MQGITHLLLDIEGTTCPVSFVAEVLFPYAREKLTPFIGSNAHDAGVKALLAEAAADMEPGPYSQSEVIEHLERLIDNDQKLPALKELQGMIWEQGYAKGELHGPLFSDVPPAFHRWLSQGLTIAVYSSGSIKAQQLLYQHSNAGDLRPLIKYWFDTRTGPKKEESSYRAIAQEMGIASTQILFISDIKAELEAASASGMNVLFSDREGNPEHDAGSFERICSYDKLVLEPIP
ncbi:MAG: acireductone synthase [Cyanobacteriota bacterium]|jgi:enolase-phosphatase E1